MTNKNEIIVVQPVIEFLKICSSLGRLMPLIFDLPQIYLTLCGRSKFYHTFPSQSIILTAIHDSDPSGNSNLNDGYLRHGCSLLTFESWAAVDADIDFRINRQITDWAPLFSPCRWYNLLSHRRIIVVLETYQFIFSQCRRYANSIQNVPKASSDHCTLISFNDVIV